MTIKEKGQPETGSNEASSSQSYFFLDSTGNVFSRVVSSVNNLPVSNVTQVSSMQWWADPYWGRREPEME